MPKVLSQTKFLQKVYTQEVAKVFSIKNVCFLPSKKIYFTFDPRAEVAYTRLAGSTTGDFRIVFGGGMVARTIGLPDEFYNVAEANKFLIPSDKAFQGLYYHEMGHILFTDMRNQSIVEYPKPEYRNFLHSLFNTLEDIVIERYCMSYYYPYTAKYFKFLVDNLFVPQIKDYKDQKGNANVFLQFLLLKLRLGSKFTGTNATWHKHQATLAPLVLSILREEDATKRVEKCIKLGEWIIKNTDLKCEEVTMDSDEVTAGAVESGAGTGKPRKAGGEPAMGGSRGSKAGPEDMGTPSGSSSQDRSSDSGFDGKKPELKTKDELDNLADIADKEINETYNPDNDLLIKDCPEIADSFNDVLGSCDNHMWVDASQTYVPNSKVEPAVRQRMMKYSRLATEVGKAFSVYKGRMRPKMNRGFHSGKLDMRTVMNNALTKGCNTKLFQRKVSNGNAPDLAVSILCDNSGSMGGNKSFVCTAAMLAFARACQLCDIPIEINAFVEVGGLNYTIQMKKFEDSLDKAMPFLGITDSNIIDCYAHDNQIHNFYGNEDEVNLYFVWKELLRNKHKDKVIIVISDGETCGDNAALRRVVDGIKKSGIAIIGLGIQSRAVSTIYPEYKLFDTEQSLQELPEYLTQELLKLARGGK